MLVLFLLAGCEHPAELDLIDIKAVLNELHELDLRDMRAVI